MMPTAGNTALPRFYRTVAAITISVAIALVPCTGRAGAPAVDIVVSEVSAVYGEAANIVREDLASRAAARIVPAEKFEQSPPSDAVLTIALGARALRSALAAPRGTAVVFGLVPRAAYESALRSAARGATPHQISGVFLDQPFVRQLHLVRTVLDAKVKLGVLISADTEQSIGELQAAARNMPMTVTREVVNTPGDIYPALARLLPQVDAVLALPDATVYNPGTIQNILLTTYRAQRPVFGFSAAYVRAGALAAVYSTPRDIGPQVAELAARALAGGTPVLQYPQRFTVGINAEVARSLDLPAMDESALAAKLQRLERGP